MRRSIALVGIGKIAVDQHVPAITGSDDWQLAATVSRNGRVAGVPGFADMEEMLTACPDIGVISLALPPVPRFGYARAALLAGRHVMLEKPPGATLAEVQALHALAGAQGVTLFATWHSRMAAGVAPAKAWLAGRRALRAHVTWAEDVRKWHPGQDWVFEPGGMGVFDPGINALSILTEILPDPVHLTKATLHYPKNRQTPIAADLTFSGNVTAHFDWRHQGVQTWEIKVETTDGTLALKLGGKCLFINGNSIVTPCIGEYPGLYARMVQLLRSGTSDVDLAPMIHVADAMTLGRRETVDTFAF